MVSSNNSIFGTEKFKIYKTMYTLGMGKSALFYMILFQIQLCQPKKLEMLYFHFFEKLKTNRTCNLVNGVISDIDGQVQYMRVEGAGEMLSGIVNNFADKHKQRIDTLIATYGGNKHIEEVNSYSIKNIIIQFQISSITILSIDTEGSELHILKTFPFEIIKPKLILVENNFRSQEFSNFLTSKGYHYCFRLGDDIFCDQPITTYIKIKIWLFRFLKKTKKFKQFNG